MRIVDSHQHFWIQDTADYPWLIEEYGPIFRDFLPAELEPQLAAAGVTETVIVQAANTYKDTESMLAQAAEFDWATGVVGWVPLTDKAEAARKLDEAWLNHPAFCGVRHLNHEEDDPAWIVRDDVIAGLAELESRDLAFDVVAVFPEHLEHVPTIAKARPGLRIVIDHLAKPPIGSENMGVWKDQMSKAAHFPNVHAKVSGLNTAVGKEDWDAGDLVASIGHTLELFGVDRMMFGSDWPVAILAGTYQKVWDETVAALDLLGLNDNEQSAVLGETAVNVYRLGELS